MGVGAEGGDSVLFNRKNDPLQIGDLYNDPARKEIVADLTERTIEHNRKVGSPPMVMDWLTALQSK